MPSWTLVSPSPAPAPAAPVTSTTTPVAGNPGAPLGLLRPFRRDQANDFASGTGGPLRACAVGQVLGTRRGELAWDGDFGSQLHLLRHRNNNPAKHDLARVYALDALAQLGLVATVQVQDQDQQGRFTMLVDGIEVLA